jgi:hypothetical protein
MEFQVHVAAITNPNERFRSGSCQIFMNLELWRQGFEKSSNIKLHENPSDES